MATQAGLLSDHRRVLDSPFETVRGVVVALPAQIGKLRPERLVLIADVATLAVSFFVGRMLCGWNQRGTLGGAGVGIMAGETVGGFGVDSRVERLDPLGVVAVHAELRHRGGEQTVNLCSVSLMTGRALSIAEGGVNVRPVEDSSKFGMTTETGLSLALFQQSIRFAGVGGMTLCTIPPCCGWMGDRTACGLDHFRVTGLAETLSIGDEKVCVRGRVGIVAGGAIARVDGAVHTPIAEVLTSILVALVAEFARLRDQLAGRRIMTSGAGSFLERRMEFLPEKIGSVGRMRVVAGSASGLAVCQA